MYKLKVAKYENGREKYVVIDDDYNIREATLIYIEALYSGHKIN